MATKGNISKAIVERIESKDFAKMPASGDITVKMVQDLFMSITKATSLLGVSTTQYTRRLLKAGTLGGIKIHVRGNRTRWFLLTQALNEYKNYQLDKRRLTRYIVKMPQGHLDDLRTWLVSRDSECEVYPQTLEKRKRQVPKRDFFDGIEIDRMVS